MEVMPVQTLREIQALLATSHLRPRRQLGQHFLIDGNLMRRLVAVAEIGPDDAVLEVGAGTGGLTDLLVAHAGRVVAVEIDPRLCGILRDRFAATQNLTVLEADALETKNRVEPAVIAAVGEASQAVTGRRMMVANLPYDIATPLLVGLLIEPVGLERFCFTVQREVGARIEAAPGSKDYGPLSIVLQTTCRITRVCKMPASVFWPRPAVQSAMYRVDVTEHPPVGRERLAAFVALVRGAFLHRRKTLRYNLAHVLTPGQCQEAEAIVDLARRPETLAPAEWVRLTEAVHVSAGRTAP